jgi:hypothetical protein
MKILAKLQKMVAASALVVAVVVVQTASAEMPAVSEYVHQVFVSGIPYEEASQYTSKDVPVLLKMLEDEREKPYWANIALVLEIIGDESALDGLIAFIEKDPGGAFTEEHYVAKTSAIMGLGYLVNKSGSKKALAYLKGGVSADFWTQKKIPGLTRLLPTEQERNNDMSKYAMFGLALSGHPEAEKTLRSLQGVKSGVAAQSDGTLEQALQANQDIAKEGLKGYYQKRELH